MEKNNVDLLIGNHVISVFVKKLNDNKLQIKDIVVKRVSKENGDCKFNQFVDKEYFVKVAKIAMGKDKHDENVKVKFGERAKGFLDLYDIKDSLILEESVS